MPILEHCKQRSGFMLSTYYAKALVFVSIGIFYANVPRYVYDRQGWTVLEAPKDWVLLFCLFSLPILIKRISKSITFTSPIMVWCLGYAALAALSFLVSTQSDIAWQEVRRRFLTIIEIVVFLMVFTEPGASRLARKTLVPAVLIAVGFNVYELFAPLSFSEVVGRSAGLYESPIMSGEAIVLGMILSVPILAPRYRGPFILLAGLGTLLTFSRAAIVAWIIAVFGLILLRGISLKYVVRSCLFAGVLVIFLLLPKWDYLVMNWERTGVVNVNLEERLAWFTNPFGVSDHSSWERKYLAERAWDKIAQHPFFGHGTGSSYEAYMAPHNQYLSFMLDHGVIGIMILPLLILAAMWGARGEVKNTVMNFGCAILILSLFTHTILNTPYSLVLLSLMAAMAMCSHQEIKETTAMFIREEPVQALANT
jgi:O-antigen ligase